MSKQHGPWTIQHTESRYKDDFIELCVDDVRKPDGAPGQYATVQLKKGVAILPIDREGNVHLTRQFRYAIGAESIEVISGGIDGEEAPLAAAQREAREELGIEAEEWRELGYFHLETSIVKGPVYLFAVHNLHFGDTDPDDTENIRRLRVPLEEAVQMVLHNKITHGPSCLLILKAYAILKGK